MKSILCQKKSPRQPSTPRPAPKVDIQNVPMDQDCQEDQDIVYDSSQVLETVTRLKELIQKRESSEVFTPADLEPIMENLTDRNNKISSIRLRRAQSLDQTNKKKVQNIRETAPVSTTIPAIPSISLKTPSSLQTVKPPTTIRRTVSLAQQKPTEPIAKKPFLKRKSVTFKDL